MNRQQRRKANKAKPAYLRETPEQREKRMIKNGITREDLKANYDKGFEDGYRDAGVSFVKGCYAAVCLALINLHSFDTQQCMDVLNKIEEHMLYTLSTEEAINEVWERINLVLNFEEPFDRIQERTEE